MANKALGIGVNSVLHWFDTNAELPYYSVWQGKNLLFQNSSDDMEIAMQKLNDNISAAEQNGYNEVMILKLHPKKEKSGYVTDKTETIASFTFRPSELQNYVPIQQAYNQPNNAILEKLNGIESRIAAIESDDEDSDEQSEEKPKGILGMVENLLQNEQIQMAMAGIVTNFIGKILTPKDSTKQMALAGIPEEQDEKILLAINILKQHNEFLGDDLLKLSEMAVSNNGQFNFLLSMLRK